MPQAIEVTLDQDGAIVIPAETVRTLGLSPGLTLVAEEAEEGGIRLRVQPGLPMLVAKGGVLVVNAEPLADLSDVVRRERDRRVLQLIEQAGL